MKDSHLYQRMSNPYAFKVYMNMIRTYELDIVHDLYKNLQSEADDHPRFVDIKSAYEARTNGKKE